MMYTKKGGIDIMENKNKIFIVVAVLCAIAIVFGAYKLGNIQAKGENLSVFGSVYVPPTPTHTPTATPTPTHTPSPTPLSEIDKKWEEMKKISESKGIVCKDVVEDEIYKKKSIIKMSSGLIVEFINNKHNIQPYYPNQGEAYIVDISLINFSKDKSSQYISYDNFEVVDSYGRTYKPDLSYNSKGDITGELTHTQYKRGEVCFSTPLMNVNFIDYRPVYSDNLSYVFNVKSGQEKATFQLKNEKP